MLQYRSINKKFVIHVNYQSMLGISLRAYYGRILESDPNLKSWWSTLSSIKSISDFSYIIHLLHLLELSEFSIQLLLFVNLLLPVHFIQNPVLLRQLSVQLPIFFHLRLHLIHPLSLFLLELFQLLISLGQTTWQSNFLLRHLVQLSTLQWELHRLILQLLSHFQTICLKGIFLNLHAGHPVDDLL